MNFVTNYNDLEHRKPWFIKRWARSVTLDGLNFLNGFGAGNRLSLSIPRIQFLFFHHVFEDEVDSFENLITLLSRDHEFISYSEAASRIINSEIDRPYIAFSSDDGLHSNLRAAEILERYGANACFFLNPYAIGLKDGELEEFCANQLHSQTVRFLSWDDIDDLISRGHEFGSHTMRHSQVSRMSKEAFVEDLQRSKEVLNKRCGQAKHFAFPYGKLKHFSREAHQAVFAAGFETCASAERGCHFPHDEAVSRNDLMLNRDLVTFFSKPEHNLYFVRQNAKKGMR